MDPLPSNPSFPLPETVAQTYSEPGREEEDLLLREGGGIETVGRYRLDGELAQGGMGIIFAGRDVWLQRRIACKILKLKYIDNHCLRLRFVREAHIMGNLHHPGIVPIYNKGNLPDSRPFFTMRLVEGTNLDQLLRRRSCPLEELPKFLKIFESICHTVAFAHAHGVVHRDLKPANIMVGDLGIVHVMDWGVSKILPESSLDDPYADQAELLNEAESPTHPGTQAGIMLGTLGYMSPEQTRGELDYPARQIDVFGLGAILCEILTGSPPFAGAGRDEIIQKSVTADLRECFERLDASRAEPELIRLAKTSLAADYRDRPIDAVGLSRDFTNYLEFTLRQPERDLVRFFELSLDLFCIANMNGYFLRVNSNFSRILGFPSEELVSKPFMDFVHPDDQQATRGAMDQLERGEEVILFQNRYRDVFGGYHRFEWTAKVIATENVIYAVARDITQRRT